MTAPRDGWSVGVDGQNVIVSFPVDDNSARRVMSRRQARVLREQLRLAYLLAGRNRYSADEAAGSSALMRDQLQLRQVEMTVEERARYNEYVQSYLEKVERAGGYPSRDIGLADWENLDARAESGEESESPAGAERGYEIRDKRDSDKGRPSIEAWLPGWYWPVVQAIAHEGAWLVLADLKVAELAGVSSAFPAAEAINADRALEWVDLITGLYVKALERQTASRADRWPVDVAGSDREGWSITIPGAPIAATGSTLVEAVGGVVRELREYAADWAARQRIGPVHVKNWWLVELVAHASDDQLACWIRSSAPALTWLPMAEFLAQWRGAQAYSGQGDDTAGLDRETDDDEAIADASSDERKEQ